MEGGRTSARPSVVFVNNLFSSRRTWARLVPEVARRCDVVTYDLREQGPFPGRAAGPCQTGLEEHVDDLAALLDERGLERVWLVGTSFSTMICREFALRHPSRVACMVLGGPVFGPFGGARREYLLKSCLHTLDAGGPAALFAHLYPLVLSDRAVQCNGATGFLALRETFMALYDTPLSLRRLLAGLMHVEEQPARLLALGCPVLLVAGDGDFFGGAATVEATAALFPRGSHVVLPGAGHLCYVDMPARFDRLIAEFVEARDAA